MFWGHVLLPGHVFSALLRLGGSLRCFFFCFAAFMSRFFSTFMPCLVSSITLGLFFINVLVSICSLVSFFALRLIYSCGCSLVGLRVFCVVSLFRKGVPFCFLSLP